MRKFTLLIFHLFTVSFVQSHKHCLLLSVRRVVIIAVLIYVKHINQNYRDMSTILHQIKKNLVCWNHIRDLCLGGGEAYIDDQPSHRKGLHRDMSKCFYLDVNYL